jgi:hypothetical protein
VPPEVDHAQEAHEHGQNQQRKRDPVDADVIARADLIDPGLVHVLLDVARSPVVEANRDQDPGDEC